MVMGGAGGKSFVPQRAPVERTRLTSVRTSSSRTFQTADHWVSASVQLMAGGVGFGSGSGSGSRRMHSMKSSVLQAAACTQDSLPRKKFWVMQAVTQDSRGAGVLSLWLKASWQVS